MFRNPPLQGCRDFNLILCLGAPSACGGFLPTLECGSASFRSNTSCLSGGRSPSGVGTLLLFFALVPHPLAVGSSSLSYHVADLLQGSGLQSYSLPWGKNAAYRSFPSPVPHPLVVVFISFPSCLILPPYKINTNSMVIRLRPPLWKEYY